MKIILKIISAVAVIVIVCIFAFLLFPDRILNWCVKPVIIKAIADAYPDHAVQIQGMKYSVGQNCFEFDSVAVRSADGKVSFTMGSLAVSGIGWFHILLGGVPVPEDAANGRVDAKDISVKFLAAQYELRIESLHASVPESLVVVENGEIDLLGDDEQFFAGSPYRRTRFRAYVRNIEISGLAGLELIQGKSFRTRSINSRDLFLDILVNNDKKISADAPAPSMPNEILASIKPHLQIDELTVMNARLQYGERDGVGSKPAEISFDSLQMMAGRIANHGNLRKDIIIQAKGKFMKNGIMNVAVAIPVLSRGFSLRYGGSLSGMDAGDLNTFLETAEQIRMKGRIQEAAFTIDVVSGHAVGTVRAVYKDLSMTFIDKKTGSKKGASDRLASFITNAFILRKNNMPDRSGVVVIGKVQYTRKADDPFFRFVWFALRSGVMDVAGF